MTVIYFEDDANPDVLEERAIGVIGYGRVGKPFATNLRMNGRDIYVSGSPEEQIEAQADGYTVGTIPNIARQCDILLLALPDEIMPDIYIEQISPHLQRNDMLVFVSAYNLSFGLIEPPPFVDVTLMAPRTSSGAAYPGVKEGEGYLSFIAVGQDASRQALDLVLAMAHATELLAGGAIEINITQEAEISLFIQQAIFPAFYDLMVTAARLLMNEGYPPEVVLTDLYLSGKFNDYVKEIAHEGLYDTIQNSGEIGRYGMMSRLDRFRELKLERLMEITLDEIRNGNFSREWTREFADGLPRLKKLSEKHDDPLLWDMEAQTLELREDF